MAVKTETSREFHSKRRQRTPRSSLQRVHPSTKDIRDDEAAVAVAQPRGGTEAQRRSTAYRPKWARNRPPVLTQEQRDQAEVEATPGLLAPMRVDVWKEPHQHNHFELRASMRTAFPPALLYSIACDFDGAPRMFRDMAVCTAEPLPAARGTGSRAGAAPAAGAGDTGGREVPVNNWLALGRGGVARLLRRPAPGEAAGHQLRGRAAGEQQETPGGAVKVFRVRQSVRWRYLFLSGTLDSVVTATRDDANRSITFQLAQPGFMRGFEGVWAVRPLEPTAGPASVAPGAPQLAPSFASLSATQRMLPPLLLGGQGRAGAAAMGRERGKKAGQKARAQPAQGSEMTLHQKIQPFFLPPGPIGLMYGILRSQVRNLFDDVCIEAMRQQLQSLEANGPTAQQL